LFTEVLRYDFRIPKCQLVEKFKDGITVPEDVEAIREAYGLANYEKKTVPDPVQVVLHLISSPDMKVVALLAYVHLILSVFQSFVKYAICLTMILTAVFYIAGGKFHAQYGNSPTEKEQGFVNAHRGRGVGLLVSELVPSDVVYVDDKIGQVDFDMVLIAGEC
jgi:magnesium-transporting ATPase (P-type)